MSESVSEMSDISIEPTEPDAARGGGGGGTNATAASVSGGGGLSGSINGGVGGGDEVEDALESGGTKLLSSDADGKGIVSVMSASVLLMTWSTSSSNVMYPWTYGVLGVLGGPMLMGAAFFINWQV